MIFSDFIQVPQYEHLLSGFGLALKGCMVLTYRQIKWGACFKALLEGVLMALEVGAEEKFPAIK